MKQKTLNRSVTLKGRGLHTGLEVTVTVHPAAEDMGIIFKNSQNSNEILNLTSGGGYSISDANDENLIPASIQYADDMVRGTTLCKDGVKVCTIEHLLSALYGLGINNVLIEMDGPEVPILDGSAKPWVDAFMGVGLKLQNAEVSFLEITEPISIVKGDRSIMIVPSDNFQVTCTSTDDRKTHTQHLSLTIDADTYQQEIAGARTFTTYEDIEPLIKMGKIKGGSLDCAIVIRGDTLLCKEPLRFPDEFVRHKILDIIGDFALLGKPIKGHIIAIKTGHALNTELAQAIFFQEEQESFPLAPMQGSALLNINAILKRLPHRYPFVMVDRVLSATDDTLVAIKNIAINEPCFIGHFPENPVFPGVLQIEAMAQAAGLLMGLKLDLETSKKVFFMSADKVKFRSVVQPGDQLRIEIKLIKVKNNRIGYAEGQCFVQDKIASSAELMFMIAVE